MAKSLQLRSISQKTVTAWRRSFNDAARRSVHEFKDDVDALLLRLEKIKPQHHRDLLQTALVRCLDFNFVALGVADAPEYDFLIRLLDSRFAKGLPWLGDIDNEVEQPTLVAAVCMRLMTAPAAEHEYLFARLEALLARQHDFCNRHKKGLSHLQAIIDLDYTRRTPIYLRMVVLLQQNGQLRPLFRDSQGKLLPLRPKTLGVVRLLYKEDRRWVMPRGTDVSTLAWMIRTGRAELASELMRRAAPISGGVNIRTRLGRPMVELLRRPSYPNTWQEFCDSLRPSRDFTRTIRYIMALWHFKERPLLGVAMELMVQIFMLIPTDYSGHLKLYDGYPGPEKWRSPHDFYCKLRDRSTMW